MKNILKGFIVLLLCGVFGDPDEMKSLSVNEGDSVTLPTDTNIQRDDKIFWRFEEAGSAKLIVQMLGNRISFKDYVDGRFKDRLQILDSKSGDLTIKRMRIKHTGLYEAEINTGTGTVYKKFHVTVKESPRVIEAGTNEVKSVSVTEGESVTLHTDVQTRRDDLILWRFGDKNVLIAKCDLEDNKTSVHDVNGTFRDRLKLHDQTGDLTITNILNSDAGVYELKIISSRETKDKTFTVSVIEEGLSAVAKGFIVFFSLLVAAGAGVLLYRSWMSQKLQKKLMDEMKTIEATVGHTVLLDIGADIQTDKEWRFKETLIAKVKRKVLTITPKGCEIFGDRLQLNKQSGDLKIKDIRIKHAGLYKVKIISSKGTSYFLFNVIVKARVRTVESGDSVIIPTGIKKIQTGHEIEWKFKKSPGDELSLAEILGTSQVIYKERFNGRLTVDPKTGDLIIKEVTAVDTGLYILHDKTRKRQSNFYVAIDVTGTKGNVITLEIGSELPVNTEVEWSFSHEVKLFSEDTKRLVTGKIGYSCDTKNASGRFRGRLKMNTLTGDLTIHGIKRTFVGFYTLKLIKTDGEITYRIFKVDVMASSGGEQSNSDDDEDPKDSARTYRNDPAVDIPLLEKV